MKTITIVFIIFAGLTRLTGQEPIEVKIEQRPSSYGIHPAFEVVVPQATSKEAVDLWKNTITPGKLLKKTPKMEKVEDEWIVNEVNIDEISSYPLDVITQVSSYPGHIYVRIFLKGEQGFLGTEDTPENIKNSTMSYIRNYGVELYRLAVEKELKEEEKILNNLQNDLKKLKNQKNNNDDKISDSRKEQNNFEKEVEYNRQLLEEGLYLTEDSKKEIEEQLKSKKKDLKKAKKVESRLGKKARKNEKEQRDKEQEIEKQKEIVLQIKNKLENIR